MERYCGIIKEQMKHNGLWQILLSAVILLLSPLILGLRNLDAVQSAKVLEMYVALIGIILLVPVFQPEQNKDLRDLIQSKYTKISVIYSVRVLAAICIGGLMLLIYMFVMKQGNCEMETGKYFFGVMAEILAFGGLGILAYSLSDNVVIGYMAPAVYYVAAYGGGAKYLKKFYPFGMVTDYDTKYVLFAAGLVCILFGIIIRGKSRR